MGISEAYELFMTNDNLEPVLSDNVVQSQKFYINKILDGSCDYTKRKRVSLHEHRQSDKTD